MTRLLRSFAITAACAVAALISSCGPSTSLPAGYASCAAPSAICISGGHSSCINITTDPNNCGACGTVCETPQAGGTATCVAGECAPVCPTGMMVCGLADDSSNFVRAHPDVSADGGTSDAGTTPDAGSTDAGTSDAGTSDAGTADAGTDAGMVSTGSPEGALICISIQTDPNHCGSCDVRCLDTEVCQAGICVAAGTDSQGTTACGFADDGGPEYFNLQTDPNNCGACGNVCAASEVCVAGGCSPCEYTACNNVCVNPNVDVNNCGGCGIVAPTCANGMSLAKPVITIAKPETTGFLPAGSGTTIGVSVASGIRLASVSVVATLMNGSTTTSAPLMLTLNSDPNVSPTSWSFVWGQLMTTAGVPLTALAATNTVSLTFTANDEQYMVGRADAASHTATLTWTGTVPTIGTLTLAIPSATTTAAGAAATLNQGSWVPLNGAPIVFTESVAMPPAAGSNIVGVEFHSVSANDTTQDVVIGGTSSVVTFTGNSATITVSPNLLGVGPRNIVVESVDVFGDRTPLATALTLPLALTVGDIAPYVAGTLPILTHGNDGVDSIWLPGPATAAAGVCTDALTSNFYAQGYDQPAGDAGMVGAKIGSTMFCSNSMVETYESTGVYGVKADGTSIARFDNADGGETDSFIVMPATSTTKFSLIESQSVTPVALAADDNGAPSNLWFALAKQGVGDLAPELAGGTDGGSVVPVLPVDGSAKVDVQSSTAGALWAFVDVPTTTAPGSEYQLDIFHPAITGTAPNAHVKSYLTAANAIPQYLTVFPGGEFVWDVADSTTGNLSLGAGRFDGTNQPVDVTGATVVMFAVGDTFSVGPTATASAPTNPSQISSFFVPKPGILVGLTPSKNTTNLLADGGTILPDGGTELPTSLGEEVIEIDLTATPAKVYQPLQITSTSSGAGPVIPNGVQTRYGGASTFTVSDDLTKVLFVTKDPLPQGHDGYSIRLLDLATGAPTLIYTSEYINNGDVTNNNGRGQLTMLPHFLHGMNSYGTLPVTTPPIIVWAEELPVAGAGTAYTVYERLFYANYSTTTPAPVQIDHLAFELYNSSTGSAQSQLVAESVTADGIFFLNDDGGGELSLYGRAFDGSASATLVAKGVVNWALREDVQRQMVLRSDGSVLVGSLSSSPMSVTAVYKGDSGSDANISLAPLGGFTPDGNHVWTLVHAGESLGGGGNLLDGTLVTIDLTSGAHLDWGEAVNLLVQTGDPAIDFLGAGVSTIYAVDRVSGNENLVKLYTSTSAATTTHATIPNIPTGFAFTGGASSEKYSLDLNESLFSPPGNQMLDVTAAASNAQLFAVTSVGYSGFIGRVQPDAPIFGPMHLPEWEILTANTGASFPTSGMFKQFGGTTFQPQIIISAGATVDVKTTLTKVTPDFSQLLGHFEDGAGLDYVMKLPGPGVAVPNRDPP